MIESDRVLQPLERAEDAVRRLRDYRTPAELGRAVEEVWRAVERSLRLMLRMDPATPDAIRLAALSPDELPLQRLIEALRRRDLISIALAGTATELGRAAARAAGGAVHATDADLADRVVARLRAEAGAARARVEPEPQAVGGPPAGTAEPPPPGDPAPARSEPRVRPINIAAAVLALLALSALVFGLFRALDDRMDEAVAAFEAGRTTVAIERFREVVRDAPENITARLYLARIYRREGQYRDAAEQLRAAVAIDPRDADVRRELGHLFLELGRPAFAVEQYRRAVEAEPDSEMGWIGLMAALRATGDPSADDLLRRAPPAVRAALDGRR